VVLLYPKSEEKMEKKERIQISARSHHPTSEAHQFLIAIFGANPSGFIEIRMIRDKKVSQLFYRTPSEVVKDLFTDRPYLLSSWNVYFGVCLRKEKRGREEDISSVGTLFADIDCVSDEERETKLASLKSSGTPPSIIVRSGHGFHCYWLLRRGYGIKSKEDLLHVKGYLKGLAVDLGADKTFDLSRVLRLPGTKNLKNPQHPLPVRVLEMNCDRKYDLKDFEKFWLKAKDTSPTPGTNLENIPDGFWRILQEDQKLNNTWQGRRNDLDDKTRSGYDMALASLLMPHEFTDGEIASILMVSPSGKGKEATSAYLAHTIGKARSSWRKREPGKRPKPSKSRFNPRPYSLDILAKHSLKYDRKRRFWTYNKEADIWYEEAEIILNSILRKRILGDDDYKRYCVAEIIDDLKGLTTIEGIPGIPEEPEPYLIPFKNKIYNLKTDQFVDYSPDYFFINKLNSRINTKNRECPTIDRIFKDLVAPDDVKTLYEILAYCLYRAYPYPKVFILYGSGGNGKTAYLKIITRLLGRENISLAASDELQYNRFASSQLFGKMLNISGEMDYTIIKKTGMVKRCTGEDLIYCERKFKEPFPFMNYAKMVFLTNQVPLTTDKTYAFYRRIFLLEFPNRFVLGENADPMIIERIPQEEFEGLAWKCLQILKELYARDFIFTNHEKTEEVTQRYEDLSNPLNKFLEEHTVRDANGDIPVGDFFERYIAYLEEQRFRKWNNQEVNKAMREKGFEQKSLAGAHDNPTYRAWLRLGWK